MQNSWKEFGNFDPHRDKDAPIRFVLSILLSDGRLRELVTLLANGGTISGEPGWFIERTHCLNNAGPKIYDDFIINVAKKGCELMHPEMRISTSGFCEYLCSAMKAYLKDNFSDNGSVDEIMEICERDTNRLQYSVLVPSDFTESILPHLDQDKIEYHFFVNGDFGDLTRIDIEHDHLLCELLCWSSGMLHVEAYDTKNNKGVMNISVIPEDAHKKPGVFFALQHLITTGKSLPGFNWTAEGLI